MEQGRSRAKRIVLGVACCICLLLLLIGLIFFIQSRFFQRFPNVPSTHSSQQSAGGDEQAVPASRNLGIAQQQVSSRLVRLELPDPLSHIRFIELEPGVADLSKGGLDNLVVADKVFVDLVNASRNQNGEVECWIPNIIGNETDDILFVSLFDENMETIDFGMLYGTPAVIKIEYRYVGQAFDSECYNDPWPGGDFIISSDGDDRNTVPLHDDTCD